MGEALVDGVPEALVGRLRSICLALPEATEEAAWVGRRWCVRSRNFAHVFAVDEGSSPSLLRIARRFGPSTVLVFRSEGPELDALRHQGDPFFYAGWGRDVVGMVLREGTRWDEVAELLTESYCVLAPRKLVALVERPA